MSSNDPRIPIVFNDAADTSDAVWHGISTNAAHMSACACCGGRSPAAQALDQLYLQRVRGEVAWFDRLVAPTAAEPAIRDAVATDRLIMARWRID